MLQLICHHTYKLPSGAVGSNPPYVAMDLSRFENHGSAENTEYTPNGSAPSSGAMLFQLPTSIVKIAQSPSFREVGELRIEVQVRLDRVPTVRMSLVEAGSFSFFIEPGGILNGYFFGPLTPGTQDTWIGVESQPPMSPDGTPHTVPVGTWTTLSYAHDGLGRMEIAIDGLVVGRRGGLISGVAPVRPDGVSVGALWLDIVGPGPKWDKVWYPFQGAIDDLKIWRRDPDAMTDEFFSRPFNEREGACWARLFISIRDRLELRDEALLQFLQQFQQLLEEGLRRAAGDPLFISRNRGFAERYHRIWRSGGLASDDMRDLLREWIPEAIHATGIKPSNPEYHAVIERLLKSELTRQFQDFNCDPAFAKFLELVQEQVGSH